jgi:phosphinothricin acetyltransferase
VEDIVIRPAVPADVAAIARIYNQAVEHSTATFDTEPETTQDRERWFEEHTAPQHPVLVAELDGDVVGWASLSRYSTRCAYIATAEASAYVDEAHTGRGIGRRLSEALLEAGRAGGVHAVIVRICTENVASLALSRRLGYFEVGVMREVGMKFGRLLDVMVLEKLLNDGDAGA